MVANKLTLIISNSNVILISAKNNKACCLLTFEPLYNAVLLEFLITKCAKFSGVTFDNSLLFDLHINNLTKKLSKSVEILAKLKRYLNKFVLCYLPIAFAIWFSHMELNI